MKSHQKHFMSCHLAARQYYDADLVFDQHPAAQGGNRIENLETPQVTCLARL